jgi:hypothetical protein
LAVHSSSTQDRAVLQKPDDQRQTFALLGRKVDRRELAVGRSDLLVVD